MRFALSSVRTDSPLLERRATDRLHRQRHPLSQSRGKAQAGHRGTHTEVRPTSRAGVFVIDVVLGIIFLQQSTLKTQAS